jgi:hypothetical protein
MATINFIIPLLESPFGCMLLGGIMIFTMSAYCRSPRAASRFQAIAFGIFTAGSVTIVKRIAEAYQR